MTPEQIVDKFKYMLPKDGGKAIRGVTRMIQRGIDDVRAEARKVCPCECHLLALQTALGIEEHENCGLCAREMKRE